VATRSIARPLGVDIYRPAGIALGVAVILLHGGGWMVGDRADMADYATALADHGFVAIAAEYRLLGEAPWPAQIIDVKDVINWAADHADEFGFAADKIAVMGMSAGGHLALLAAGQQGAAPVADQPHRRGAIAAVISAFAPPELTLPAPGDPPSPVAALLGPTATTQDAHAASPIHHIKPGFPATMLLSGTSDRMVPHQAQIALFEILTAAGVPTDLRLYHGHTHEFTRLPSMLATLTDDIALFLKRAVVDPDYYAAEAVALNPFARPGFVPGPPAARPDLALAEQGN
jgi:acetyl esterase/lipase